MDSKTLLEAISKLSYYQKQKICEMITIFSGLNKELSEMLPEVCPRCGKKHTRFVRVGFVNGKQRFLCKECGKKFVFDRNRITAHSHQSAKSWSIAIEDTLRMVSLDVMAEHIGVCHTTAFYMRHKILMCMENAVKRSPELDGLIEADETYLPESQKGSKVTNRKARKHGAKVNKKGLSDEQICICVATDRENHVIAKSVNRAKASSNDIKNALEDKIAENSIIQCDGSDSYNFLIAKKHCKKVELIGHQNYDKVYHLNTVNGIHSRIKEMNRQYRGVSTKYLNRYMSLFMMKETNKGKSIEEMADWIRKQLESVFMDATISDVRNKNLLCI